MTTDIELTQAALTACGYRTKLRERAGTQWVEAIKSTDVRYVHWHPLTNISQAMQLLIDAPVSVWLTTQYRGVEAAYGDKLPAQVAVNTDTAQDLINAQCRAIVTAIAGLKS